jgi:hypothetical protein
VLLLVADGLISQVKTTKMHNLESDLMEFDGVFWLELSNHRGSSGNTLSRIKVRMQMQTQDRHDPFATQGKRALPLQKPKSKRQFCSCSRTCGPVSLEKKGCLIKL